MEIVNLENENNKQSEIHLDNIQSLIFDEYFLSIKSFILNKLNINKLSEDQLNELNNKEVEIKKNLNFYIKKLNDVNYENEEEKFIFYWTVFFKCLNDFERDFFKEKIFYLSLQIRKIMYQKNFPFITREKICRLVKFFNIPICNDDKSPFIYHKISQYINISQLIKLNILLHSDNEDLIKKIILFKDESIKQNCYDHQFDLSKKNNETRLLYLNGYIDLDKNIYSTKRSEVIYVYGLFLNQHIDVIIDKLKIKDKNTPIITKSTLDKKLSNYEINKEIEGYVLNNLKIKNNFVWISDAKTLKDRIKEMKNLAKYNANVKVVYVEYNLIKQSTINIFENVNGINLLNSIPDFEPPFIDEANNVVFYNLDNNEIINDRYFTFCEKLFIN